MRLIIGAVGQGKMLYSMKAYGFEETETASSFEKASKAKCFTHLESAVRAALKEEKDPFFLTEMLLQNNPDIIILCDEVGCGVVPIDREERRWRETVGRLCCWLAERAESVERIFCGIPMRLK